MSNHLISEAYKRQVGSMARKAVMVLLADKASDDGTGIWASKQTMADEIGTSKQTIIATLKSLIADGLVRESGQRKSPNGYTVEYTIEVAALRALPMVKCHVDRSSGFTGKAASPVKQDDLTGQVALPDQSSSLTQTLQNPPEPPLGDSASADAPLSASDVFESWNEMAPKLGLPVAKGLTPARLRQTKARLREYPNMEDWQTAFRCIAATPWLCGDNDRGWRADYDFLVQAKSFTKLVEGSYGKN